MNYDVVYLINYNSIPKIIYILIIITIAFAITLIIKNQIKIPLKAFKAIICGSILIGLFTLASSYTYFKNIYNLKIGNFSIVEGQIVNFNPAYLNAKGIESFEVNGIIFQYSSSLGS